MRIESFEAELVAAACRELANVAGRAGKMALLAWVCLHIHPIFKDFIGLVNLFVLHHIVFGTCERIPGQVHLSVPHAHHSEPRWDSSQLPHRGGRHNITRELVLLIALHIAGPGRLASADHLLKKIACQNAEFICRFWCQLDHHILCGGGEQLCLVGRGQP